MRIKRQDIFLQIIACVAVRCDKIFSLADYYHVCGGTTRHDVFLADYYYVCAAHTSPPAAAAVA